MKKTFLEWSVADKKAQWDKMIKEMLRTPVKWVPEFPRYNPVISNIRISDPSGSMLKYVKNL